MSYNNPIWGERARRNANRYAEDPEGLYQAVVRGNLAAVRAALNRGESVNRRAGEGIMTTPLMAAAQLGRVNIMRELLNRGAHIHARDITGMTPLMHAVFGNRPNAVRLLLERGANPRHRAAPGYQGRMRSALTSGTFRSRAPNALAAETYGRRWLGHPRRRHAANLLSALFTGHAPYVPREIWERTARVGNLQKRSTGPRTLGTLAWNRNRATRSPKKNSPTRKSPKKSRST